MSAPVNVGDTIAGKYLLVASVVWSNNASGARRASFYKNGSLVRESELTNGGGTNFVTLDIATLVDLNGSTDYVEVRVYQNSGGPLNVLCSSQLSSFEAALVARG